VIGPAGAGDDGAVPVRSAGLLVYRRRPSGPDANASVEVLLAHPGGPFWARRDDAWWTVPKGVLGPGEDPVAGADREFTEELGLAPPPGDRLPLGEVVQAGGKHVVAFAVEGDLDPATMVPGTTEIEWPPRSGTRLTIPEVDRAAWFGLEPARVKILPGQLPFLDRLGDQLRAGGSPAG
jgi:predicted NUDIX family NTP pyrophosphohydrolase